MRALAGYILRGPLQAILVTVGLALLSLVLFPVVNLVGALSAAALALVALSLGPQRGLLTLVGSMFALGAASLLLPVPAGAAIDLVGSFTGSFWLPVLIPAAVLYRTRSLPMALEVTALLAVVAVVAVYVVLGDPAAAWVELLKQSKQAMTELGVSPSLMGGYDVTERFAAYLTGVVLALLMVNVMFSLLLARGMQAAVSNPGGLREEFNRLRYGRVTFFLTAAALAAAIVGHSQLAMNISIVMVAAYAVHGLAVVHGIVARARLRPIWLFWFYAIMILMMAYLTVILGILGLIGLIDTWLDFRARVRPREAG
jgi:hypothetical protein